MKIIKERFENYAHEQGYESGAELMEELGLNRSAYEHFRKEVPIDKNALRTLCWELGSAEVIISSRLRKKNKQAIRTRKKIKVGTR